MKHSHPQRLSFKSVILFVVFAASAMMLWAQDTNKKFSWTTQMFLNEIKGQTEQPKSGPRRASIHLRLMPDQTQVPRSRRLIAKPDTVGGVAYISCFIHLKNAASLGDVRSLGVEVEETFDEQNFVTARVPINQLENLAGIADVTSINVAQQMRPLTNTSRELTGVKDLLTLSSNAIARGITSKYDGTGVVLGIIDRGIDFQHIAFKDKNGNSRIKRAYVFNGLSASEYTTITSSSPTTDDPTADHGTHTATTAGGSSVIVSGSTVTVTDNHASATYGGMAPGADLYLAGVYGLYNTYLANALKKMVSYADGQDKPLVVSNSWGGQYGPHDGTGELADLVGQYFGDNHPNHIILFASSNDAGKNTHGEGGGFFVRKRSTSASSPLGTIIRSPSGYSNMDYGYKYEGAIISAWTPSKPVCKLYVLNSSTGAVIKSCTFTETTSSYNGLSSYYDGTIDVYIQQEYGKYHLIVDCPDDNGIISQSVSETSDNNYRSNYTLAIEVYPASGSAYVNMWSLCDDCYFTSHLRTSGHEWTEGTGDMCVSDQATIPDAISVGAYVSKNEVMNYEGVTYPYSSAGSLGDIASFSSYATAEQSPTGVTYPWITAPGAQLVAGVNHYHTESVDDNSYYHSSNKWELVVNNSSNPYGVMQGTSMATPVAAGIVALWLQAARSEYIDLTVNDVKDIMAETAVTDSYTTGANASHFGNGKIDALAGLQYILKNHKRLTLTATPVSGTVRYNQEVKLRASNPQAIIRYTLDGTEPTIYSRTYESPIPIDRNLTLKAKAFLDGYEPSETLTRTYQVKLDIAADKTSGNILIGESVTLTCSHPYAVIYYTTDGSTPTRQSQVYTSPIRIDNSMTIKAVAMHDDCLQSDVLTRSYTVQQTGLSISHSGGTVQKGTTVTITSTPAGADIHYTLDGSEPTTASSKYQGPINITKNTKLRARAYADGYIPSSVLSADYYVKLTLQANPAAGTVDWQTEVTLTTDDTQAAIYYTTDGSTPTQASLVYRSPIVIDETTTIRAFACHGDYLSSDVLSCTYTVLTTSVSASPLTTDRLVAGNEITLTANPSNARIYYTTDGSEPTESSKLYTSPIIVERTFMLKAKAYYNGYRPGNTFTWNYNVAPEPRVITVTPAQLELFWGRTAKLTYAFTPADAETLSLTWESSNPEVATVTQKGLVRALTPGHATLTLTARNGVVGKCELNVPEPLYQLFVWSKSGLKTGYLSSDEPQFSVVGDIVRFTTSRLSMDIHRDTLDKFTLEAVLPEHPKSVIMSKSMTIPLGESEQLSVTLRPSNAKTRLTWFNDNPEVVSVTQEGLVTALAAGEANVMVQTSNGLRATCRVTVPEPFLRFFVWLWNGNLHGYDLDEHPKVEMGESVFTLRTSRQTVQYRAADIEKFTLQDEALVDGVSLPKAMEEAQFREGALIMAGGSPYSPVQVYDAAGRLVQTAKTDGEGNLLLSLASLRAGIYIICTDKTTIKIQKR